jgi:hypothetical protein
MNVAVQAFTSANLVNGLVIPYSALGGSIRDGNAYDGVHCTVLSMSCAHALVGEGLQRPELGLEYITEKLDPIHENILWISELAII